MNGVTRVFVSAATELLEECARYAIAGWHPQLVVVDDCTEADQCVVVENDITRIILPEQRKNVLWVRERLSENPRVLPNMAALREFLLARFCSFLELDSDQKKVRFKDKEIKLSIRLFQVLACLMQAGGSYRDRETILDQISLESDIFDRSIDSYVYSIRRLLKAAFGQNDFILARPQFGYAINQNYLRPVDVAPCCPTPNKSKFAVREDAGVVICPDGTEVALSAEQFAVFMVLHNGYGRTQPYRDLSLAYAGFAEAEEPETCVKLAVYRIRKSLGKKWKTSIVTHWGVGYSLGGVNTE